MRCLLALFLALSAAATAEAHWFNRLGRHLGLGWSDGYHAGPAPSGYYSDFAIPPGGLTAPEPLPPPLHSHSARHSLPRPAVRR